MNVPGFGTARRQQAAIAASGATRFASGVLMGTAMAVYVGREGSPFAVSMVLTAYFFGLMIFSPIWGAIADVTGQRRAVLLATSLVATLAVVPLVFVRGVWAPIGLRALYAIFAAGFAPVMLAIVSERGGETGRGRSMGFFNSARAFGFAGGQLIVGALLGLLAPDDLYLTIAGVSLISTLVVLAVADPTPNPDRSPSLSELLAEVRRRLLPAVGDRDHLRTNGLQWLYVALALRNMTVLGVSSLMPVYLTGNLGVSAFVMGALLALNHAGQVPAMYLFGRVADTAGRKPLVVFGMAASGIYAMFAAAASIPDTLGMRVAVAAIGFAILALAFSAMTTGALAFIGDVAPAKRESELMGLRSTAKGVGGVLGPPLLGAVATLTSIEVAYAVGSVLAFSAAAMVGVALVESRPELGLSFRGVPGDD